ncbi:hypothetical protein FACS1894103_2100 [Campylobacterota bacterium]|nr:hypothetical protein FACS1894103_2100 [Campylobacterota bacterium]
MNYTICPKCGVCACAHSYYAGYHCFQKQNGCGATFPTHIVRDQGLLVYAITKNDFLNTEIRGYSHDFYIPVRLGGGETSKIVLKIKNISNNKISREIEVAKTEISKIVKFDLDKIIESDRKYRDEQPVVVVIPISKPDNYWDNSQLQFRSAISDGISSSKWIVDGTQYLTRLRATQTTHIAHLNKPENIGEPPYPGITKDTCGLSNNIENKNIILIDDIYTVGVGIDEDCVRFLLDNGAASVVLYTLGVTIKIPNNSTNNIASMNWISNVDF